MLTDFARFFLIESYTSCELLKKVFGDLVEVLRDWEILSEVIDCIKKLRGDFLFVAVRVEKMEHPNHYKYTDRSQ